MRLRPRDLVPKNVTAAARLFSLFHALKSLNGAITITMIMHSGENFGPWGCDQAGSKVRRSRSSMGSDPQLNLEMFRRELVKVFISKSFRGLSLMCARLRYCLSLPFSPGCFIISEQLLTNWSLLAN